MMRKALTAWTVGLAAGAALLGGTAITATAVQPNEPNQGVIVQANEPNQGDIVQANEPNQ